MNTIRLGFIGSGRMASAIAKGILQKKLLSPDQLWCLDHYQESAENLAKQTGAHWTTDPAVLGEKTTHLILACKPTHLSTLPPEWKVWSREKSLLSIVAGVRIETLVSHFPETSGIIRCMPNTPAQVGAGATAYSPEEKVSSTNRMVWKQILNSLGIAIEVRESELDLVTALSGSGPAYFFEFVNLLEKAAVELGLDPKKATALARQTFIGAARLLSESGKEAAVLRSEVTTPGGTTEAGLKVFEKKQFSETLKQVLLEASQRSEELSQSNG